MMVVVVNYVDFMYAWHHEMIYYLIQIKTEIWHKT